ncbi:ankyrin repeat domain-containing protein [Bacteroidetes bacterium endosymbiont of Geopemphigus sp.]|uniref:ankyrin repeat domain-containing protein n=1 Tax=Bacteroidetes bacterium endosymbiont of Geopemphigus sp. TaxID=2047937 RepID=UPI000CD28C80
MGKSCFSETPLHWAVNNINAEAIKTLLERGANIEVKDDTGKTPLDVTVFIRNTEIIKLLLNKGS